MSDQHATGTRLREEPMFEYVLRMLVMGLALLALAWIAAAILAIYVVLPIMWTFG